MLKRKNFGRFVEVLDLPNLIDIQTDSYEHFLQKTVFSENRKLQGLHEVFSNIFPISSHDERYTLSYISYSLKESRSNAIDSIKNGDTYGLPLYVKFGLKIEDDYLEENVYMCDMPMMTDRGTFIINGVERVIVGQLQRSPGICYETQSLSGLERKIYICRIIPDRGIWLELQIENENDIYVYLDRRKKGKRFSIATLLCALNEDSNNILKQVYNPFKINLNKNEIKDYYVTNRIYNENKKLIIDEYQYLDDDAIDKLKFNNIFEVEVISIPSLNDKGCVRYFIDCISRNKPVSAESALKEIHKKIWPDYPTGLENTKQAINRLLFDSRRYDLGITGRYKINYRLNDFNLSEDVRILTIEDLVKITLFLIDMKKINNPGDDIDHLCNRRVKPVGEQLKNQSRVGLIKTERLIREKMSLMIGTDKKNIMPSKLINSKMFFTTIKDFFARSQLSQFMDQTNPLAELTNKRRLSALGPGGLNRERAGFDVRDVHTSHYGRICPIETPEGGNIGLISSVSTYSKLDKFGFIQTPYRVVKNGIVTDEIHYLRSDEEVKYPIAQFNAQLDSKNAFVKKRVMCRLEDGEFDEVNNEDVRYIDVSPKQLVSIAAALIPFLEHDDTSRALMGSNMQRQAVPLLFTEAPIIATGLEKRVAIDSKSVLVSEYDGIVKNVTGDSIKIILHDEKSKSKNKKDEHTYDILKFFKTNTGTCNNQRPIVKNGDKIKIGDVIADGFATKDGELSLGKNVTVAFMPWRGYNYEDAIVVSERVIKDDLFTSLHISELEVSAKDTKLGPEEITIDLPNISERALASLDSNGIIKIGTDVKPGDILVGRVTPRSETELAPEERLLRAIFGEKAANVQDNSLIVSSGLYGTVMDIKINYTEDVGKRSITTKTEMKNGIKEIKDNAKLELAVIFEKFISSLSKAFLDKKLKYDIYHIIAGKRQVMISSNRKVTVSGINRLAKKYKNYEIEDCNDKIKLEEIVKKYKENIDEVENNKNEKIDFIKKGNIIKEKGFIKKVKVYIATKRKLQVGDKMSGRHGNKGIVAKIVPSEDMPFLPDGTSVDIILNPLGVPSRMNVGQLLETHLGWAANILGLNVITPIFDGVKEEKIIELMKQANEKYNSENNENYMFGFVKKGDDIEFDGKTNLFDGRNGEKFDQRVTVGKMYMMKLDHLVANKMHARSVGPYSLVTQQPLGGKAMHGGQRVGEMEVWALEAYGAAYTLQEMLTIKSDDVVGRTKIYESITRGNNTLNAGKPESFNVLIKELQGLGLDFKLLQSKNNKN